MCAQQTENDPDEIASMSRKRLIRAILTLECDFPVDLTEEFLHSASTGRLRHIYLALRMRAGEPQSKCRRGGRGKGR